MPAKTLLPVTLPWLFDRSLVQRASACNTSCWSAFGPTDGDSVRLPSSELGAYPSYRQVAPVRRMGARGNGSMRDRGASGSKSKPLATPEPTD
jgi:hypothetical protein